MEDRERPLGDPGSRRVRPAVRETARVNFVRQQGFREAPASACSVRYPALMFQPRLTLVLVLTGVVLQEWLFWAGLGLVLSWSAALPRLNPFEALHNAVVARIPGRSPVPPAPGPRRFAMGLAGSLMLVVAAALLAGWPSVAWGVEAFLVVAVLALVFGKFCLGSFLFHHLRGEGRFARRTAPWGTDG